MKIKFWGVRGSIPSPGEDTVKYGGNTACIELLIPGREEEAFIFEAGTGVRKLGLDLMKRGVKKIHLFISHTHWDHIQGFPFFVPAFMGGSEITIYGPKLAGRSLKQALETQMEHDFFPVKAKWLKSQMNFVELGEESVSLGDLEISTKASFHTVVTLGFKASWQGKNLFFSSDMEKYYDVFEGLDEAAVEAVEELNQRHVDFMKGCHSVIHDAQYTVEDYKMKKGWGHSTFDDVVDFALDAKIDRLFFWSHDPERKDTDLEAIQEKWQSFVQEKGSGLEVVIAREGSSFEVG